MKNRKAIIILSSAVVIAAVGFIVSPLVDWKVDSENASGDIGKTSRFSRKTSGESLSNMEELMRNDEAYQNSIVASYYMMQTRANQFASLVDMSNEVASDIPEYASVLEDMNKAIERCFLSNVVNIVLLAVVLLLMIAMLVSPTVLVGLALFGLFIVALLYC